MSIEEALSHPLLAKIRDSKKEFVRFCVFNLIIWIAKKK